MEQPDRLYFLDLPPLLKLCGDSYPGGGDHCVCRAGHARLYTGHLGLLRVHRPGSRADALLRGPGQDLLYLRSPPRCRGSLGPHLLHVPAGQLGLGAPEADQVVLWLLQHGRARARNPLIYCCSPGTRRPGDAVLKSFDPTEGFWKVLDGPSLWICHSLVAPPFLAFPSMSPTWEDFPQITFIKMALNIPSPFSDLLCHVILVRAFQWLSGRNVCL